MLSVNVGSASSAAFQVSTPQTRADATAAAAADVAAGKAPEGVKVDLSSDAMKQAAKAKAEDAAASTDPIKMLQKQIKELQKQIAEAQKQLQAIMTKSNLTAEQKQAQASGIQVEISQLTAALATASSKLVQLIQQSQKS